MSQKMFKIIASLGFILSLSPLTTSKLYALDTRVDWSGSYRLRGLGQDNFTQGGHFRDAYFHRLTLKGQLEPNDSIRLLFAANLYQAIDEDKKRGALGLEFPKQDNDIFQLLYAHGDWSIGSSFYLHFGRLDLTWGNETLVSRNDDDQKPYSFDGLEFGYDTSDFKISSGVLRVGDWASQTGVTSPDPSENAYFVKLTLKSFFSYIDHIEGYFFRTQGDNYNDGTFQIEGGSFNRLGFSMKGSYKNFFVNADYVNLQGSFNSAQTLAAGMLQFESGWTWGESKSKKLSLIYHRDSGDKGSTTESEAYIPLYYNHHRYAGLMDILAWGNLTYYGLRFDWTFRENNNIYIQGLAFSRTSVSDGVRSTDTIGYGVADDFINQDIASNSSGQGAKKLGIEADLVYTRTFTSNVHIEFLAGLFLPGEYFEDYGRGDSLYHVRVTTGFKF